MTTPTAARDAELIERLNHAARDGNCVIWISGLIDQAITRLRELTAQPPSLPSNAEEWKAWDIPEEYKPNHVGYWWWSFGGAVFPATVLWSEDRHGHYVEDSIGDYPLCRDRGGLWLRASMPAPPAPAVLTPEEKVKAEDEQAWDVFRADNEYSGVERQCFLAGRQSLREGGAQ